MATPPAGARCARHADVPAVDVCQRCGSFVCSRCIEIRDEDVYCSACAALLDRPASKRSRVVQASSVVWLLALFAAVVAAGIGFSPVFGFICLATPFVTATLASLWMVEWRAQRRGESPAKGKRALKVSAVFIALEILISLLTVAAVVYIIVFRVYERV